VVINISELVAGMRDMLARSLGAEVETAMTGGQDIWPCEVDPGQLENAVLNLSINARDAMPKGGQLTIETSNVTMDDEFAAGLEDMALGQYVLLAVSDNGEGMTDEVIAQAFNPFFTTKDVGQGSGLGLSMIYGFAKQSGGHARIYSEVGIGTTVKIYLPRSISDALAKPDPDASVITDIASRGETVMVVEDDDDVRIVAISFLENLGYQVLAAATAAEVLAQISQKAEFDLLVADVILPGGMGGRELAERACELLPALKVLFISGYTEDAIMHHGRLDEGVQLLAKPFGQVEFAKKIREILDSDS
jgi:CheY-like chemotaxis protein